MNRTIALVLSLSLCGGVQAANKCVGPSGKIEYMDTVCPSEAKSTTVRTDRPNSIDTTHSYELGRAAADNLACDEAKETYSHNKTRPYRDAMRSACGVPETASERQPRQRTTCTGQQQAIGGGQSVTNSTCTTR